jgi:hypothetical protein
LPPQGTLRFYHIRRVKGVDIVLLGCVDQPLVGIIRAALQPNDVYILR